MDVPISSFVCRALRREGNDKPRPKFHSTGLSLYLSAPCSDRTGVSLNRYEQMLLDYVREHRDETVYWQGIIRDLGTTQPDRVQRSQELNRLLWAYFRERAGNVSPFSDVFNHEGQAVVSMQNLAEYLIERWAPESRIGHRA